MAESNHFGSALSINKAGACVNLEFYESLECLSLHHITDCRVSIFRDSITYRRKAAFHSRVPITNHSAHGSRVDWTRKCRESRPAFSRTDPTSLGRERNLPVCCGQSSPIQQNKKVHARACSTLSLGKHCHLTLRWDAVGDCVLFGSGALTSRVGTKPRPLTTPRRIIPS
jgi:hypothetical protein